MNRFAVVLCFALLPLQVSRAQDVGTIAGVVTDQVTGAPLGGARVTVPGTRFTVTTGPDGRFVIDGVPTGPVTVRVIRIGYGSSEQTLTVLAAGTTSADFQLQAQAVSLQEQVVVGYGEQQRQNVTGAVASVTAEDFVQGPARDAAALVAGRIAGLAVIQPSGNPTATAEIQLRGITTIQGPRSPLVLVDGVPGDLQTVPAGDIESVSVLKDGS